VQVSKGGTNVYLLLAVAAMALMIVYTITKPSSKQAPPAKEPVATKTPGKTPATKGPQPTPVTPRVVTPTPTPIQPPPKPPEPLPPITGTSDLKASLDLVGNRLPQACGYLLGGGPNLLSSARFKLVVEVKNSGAITASSLNTPPPIRAPIEQCVIAEVSRIKFSAGDGERSRIHEFALSIGH